MEAGGGGQRAAGLRGPRPGLPCWPQSGRWLWQGPRLTPHSRRTQDRTDGRGQGRPAPRWHVTSQSRH